MKKSEFNVSLHDLKAHYNEAVKSNKESFIYEDNVWVTDYAKYLIEYLEG